MQANRRELKIDMVAPEKLRANGFNTNIVSPENEAKIDASLDRFGFFKPVLVRTMLDGKLEIIGGQHRWESAKRKGMKEVPILNLGPLDDKAAKEISLVDNGRYGNDDTLALAELLEGLGSTEELGKFMPYSDTDFASIFSSVNIALDDLDVPEDAGAAPIPTTPAAQTHQVMRFKVPVGDADMVTETLQKIMKVQRFTESDSLSNAGDALVHLCKETA